MMGSKLRGKMVDSRVLFRSILPLAALALAGAAGCTASSAVPDATAPMDDELWSFPDAEVDGGPRPDGGPDAGIIDPDGGGPVPTWVADIQPILQSRCGQCHGNPLVGGAPFPLLTYADTQETVNGNPVHALVRERVTRDGIGRMPPNGQTDLTPAQRELIVRWSEGGAPEGDRALTFWDDVEPILRERCQQCHGVNVTGGAPFPLVDYQDTQDLWGTVLQQPIHELMAFRVTRPNAGRMPPNGQPELTELQRAALVNWSASGAVEGSRPDAGVGNDGGPIEDAGPRLPWMDGNRSPPPGPGQVWLDTFAHEEGNTNQPAVIPYSPAGTSYYCFAFTIPNTAPAEQYAVRFEPMFDNSRYIHHTFVFHHRQGEGEDWPDAFDCLENGFLNVTVNGQRRPEPIMTGWFPGRGPDETPPGVGILVRPGDQLVLQIHYDSIPQGGIRDWTGVRVLLTEQQGLINSGEVWSGRIWGTPPVPDGNGQVTIVGTSAPLDRAVTVYRAVPHMHERGLSFLFERQRAGSQVWETVVNVAQWDFHNQVIYDIPPDQQQFNAGDRVRTTCVFDTQGRALNFGEESQNEMCFTMMNHYPLTYNQDSWVVYE